MNRRSRISRWLPVLTLTLVAAAAAAQDGERYSFIRKVDGAATVFTAESESTTAAEANLPLLTGDRLLVDPGSRLDLLLSAGEQVTVDGDTEIVFDKIALSPDADADGTQLSLFEGRLLISFGDYWSAPELPVVDTQNTRIYLQQAGHYLIEAEGRGWTRVVVREGFAEVVDQRGSSVIRSGEEIHVTGDDDPLARIRVAGRETSLERWGLHQETIFVRDSDPYLEQPLEGTADLAEHGDWVDVDTERAWKPRVDNAWRPYWYGRWAPTPSGLYWVSNDPWTSATYHYGSWDYHTRFGWLWYPSYAYAPAHVYWYWGPSYTAWVPSGYYNRHYRNYYPGFGFRFGVYGWAGGGFDYFGFWNFCPTRYFGSRRPHYYYRYGHELKHHGTLGRGIITTDTRGLGPGTWNDPRRVRDTLERRFRDGERGRSGADMPDVTEFVRRNDDLPNEVRDTVLTREGRPGNDRTAGGNAPGTRGATAGPRGESPPAVTARPASGRDAAGRPGRDGAATAVARPVRSTGGAERAAPAAAPSRGDAREIGSPSRPSTAAPSEARREGPARRVLDGIRGRGAVSRPDRARPPVTAPPRGSESSGRPPSAVRGSDRGTTSRSAGTSRAGTARSAPRATPQQGSRPPSRSTGRPSGVSRSTPRSSRPPRATPPPNRSRSSSSGVSSPSRSSRAPTATRSSPTRSRPPSRVRSNSSSPSRPSSTARAAPSRSRPSTSARSAPARSRSSSTVRSAPARSRPPSVSRSSGASRSKASSGKRSSGSSRSRSSSPRRPPP